MGEWRFTPMISSASPSDGARRMATGEPLDYEARLRRGSDGVYRWFLMRARAAAGQAEEDREMVWRGDRH